MEEGRKVFFFEKEKQKTFVRGASRARSGQSPACVRVTRASPDSKRIKVFCFFFPKKMTLLALLLFTSPASADEGFLSGIHRFTTLTSTVPENGDQNPYAVVVAPVSAGRIRQDDVLVTNFNDRNNLQGWARRSSATRRRPGRWLCSRRSRGICRNAPAASG